PTQSQHDCNRNAPPPTYSLAFVQYAFLHKVILYLIKPVIFGIERFFHDTEIRICMPQELYRLVFHCLLPILNEPELSSQLYRNFGDKVFESKEKSIYPVQNRLSPL